MANEQMRRSTAQERQLKWESAAVTNQFKKQSAKCTNHRHDNRASYLMVHSGFAFGSARRSSAVAAVAFVAPRAPHNTWTCGLAVSGGLHVKHVISECLAG